MSAPLVTLTYALTCTVLETETGPFVDPTDNTVTFDGMNESGTLTGSTSIPVSAHAEWQPALVSGALTIDLTNLPGKTPDQTVNGNGLKVAALRLRNRATNTHKMTIAKGASNGYGLAASGDTWSLTLSPGQSVMIFGDGATPTIGSTAKTLDVSGTGTDVLEIQVAMG